MAINYASKYSQKVAERFKLKSLTEAGINKDYDWAGVNSINVYSVPTVALGDYTVTGTSRYGTPTELQNTIQTMTVAKDRAFSITIDRKSMDDTQGVMAAGKALARETDEVIIPEIDIYRLAVMDAAAVLAGGKNATPTAITKSNAYAEFLLSNEYFGNNKIPVNGRICWCTYAFYNAIKQDPAFMLASELSKEELVNGIVGKVDGTKIIPVPSSYLPAKTDYIVAHPSATIGADKLEDYKTHDNPPGINGTLIEGRVRYDAFVLDAKKTALYTHKNAA
jgi:N4-gp56 family major capsid protein